jgi:hypothetical protein
MISFITRTITAIFMVAILITAFAPISLAQGETGRVTNADVYTVKAGDTLYELAGVYRDDPELWRQIMIDNPFLQEKGRVFEKGGKTIVLIKPGEALNGLGRLGATVKLVPLDRSHPTPVPTLVPPVVDDSWPLWAKIMIALLTLIVALIITIIISVMRGGHLARRLGVDSTEVPYDPLDPSNQNVAPRRARPLPPLELPTIMVDLDADPATAGAPFRKEGTTMSRMVTEDAMMLAYREYARINGIPNLDRAELYNMPFQIVEVEEGTIDGIMVVRYLSGPDRIVRMNNVAGFRVTVKFPDEEQTRTLYSVQACANPARAENERENVGQQGFTFTPTTSTTQSADEPVVAAPVSAEEIDLMPLVNAAATTATEPVSEAEQGALNLPGNLTAEKFFEEMIRLGVLSEEDARRAQLAQSEPSHLISINGDRTTVVAGDNSVTFVGATGISLKRGVAVVLPTLDGIVELCISLSGEVHGYPPVESKSEPTNGNDKDDTDDIAMASVS